MFICVCIGKANQDITVILYSLWLRRDQLSRNPGFLKSRSCWQICGGGGNLCNDKLMTPWTPTSKQTWKRKKPTTWEVVFFVLWWLDSQREQHCPKGNVVNPGRQRRTGKVSKRELWRWALLSGGDLQEEGLGWRYDLWSVIEGEERSA